MEFIKICKKVSKYEENSPPGRESNPRHLIVLVLEAISVFRRRGFDSRPGGEFFFIFRHFFAYFYEFHRIPRFLKMYFNLLLEFFERVFQL